jgi:aminopeptidase N
VHKPAPQPIRREDYRPPDFLIDSVDLHFDLREDATTVRSRLQMRRNGEAGRALVMDGEKLELVSVALDGRALSPDSYEVTDEKLTLSDVPDEFGLEIVTRIKPQENTALEGLYKSSGNFCTQCEAEGFRKITYYLDRPDVMARFRTTIEADAAAYPVLLSNGNPVASEQLAEGRHRAVWDDPFPKPAYLFALVAGKLVHVEEIFTTRSGREVPFRIYVEPGNEDKVGHAMRSLIASAQWDEQVYGCEYDLDVFNIVAVGDFNMGAMENKGLNIFNTKYVLANPETATDADFLGVEKVIAHEYFHNWTGNRITCRDWFQLSLKEGLTVFRDQQFSADMNSAAVERITDVERLRRAQFPEDAGPTAHNVRPDSYIEINNFYTPTVYEKGAEVIRMMRTIIGPQAYRRGIDLYFARHDGQAVTCEDFVRCMEEASGADLGQFRLWYSQAGTPKITAKGRYEPETATYYLTLTQSVPPTPGQPEKQSMHIPVAVGLLDPDGRDMALTLALETPHEHTVETAVAQHAVGAREAASGAITHVLDLRQPIQTFAFVDVPATPVASILRGFSAPVLLETDLGEAELRFLMVHDSDPFNRWEAGQQFACRVLLRLAENATLAHALDEGFAEAFAATLADEKLDKALAARALTLPSEDYLAQLVEVIDTDAIHAARSFVRRSLAQRCKEKFLSVYRSNASNEPYSIEPDAMGRRSLRNLALRYLGADGNSESVALAAAQFRNADNMTDRIAALAVLTDTTAPERDEALTAFYDRYEDEALVVDKWFSLQAVSEREDTLEIVRRLMEHPAFSIRNPNRLRSLVGAFASGNPVRFHAKDGGGYRLLADTVLEVDRLNPQTAARILGPLRQWRRFEANRQTLMRAELERIAGAEGLSRDVQEVVGKSLA